MKMTRFGLQFLIVLTAPFSVAFAATRVGGYCGNVKAMEALHTAKVDKSLAHLGADHIVVVKSRRMLYLMNDSKVIARYRIALGPSPVGHKVREGDGRTPEGLYDIEFKNSESLYNLSLKVSYPNARDRGYAKSLGVSPGGAIMIHGLPVKRSTRAKVVPVHPRIDWTEGCMAVTDEEIREIWKLVPVRTSIEICAGARAWEPANGGRKNAPKAGGSFFGFTW